jgi:hypothetical protein
MEDKMQVENETVGEEKVEDSAPEEEIVKAAESEETAPEGAGQAEKFYTSLCEYLEMPLDRTPDNVVRASFGAVEFAVIVAFQSGVEKDNFMEVVNAIWDGSAQRHGVPEAQEEEKDEVN